MGIGALAGSRWMVAPLSASARSAGPYGVVSMQIALKVPDGALTSLLAVLLLRVGAAGLSPATGDTAFTYAVLFGFSQQAFTRLIDQQARSVTSI
jgi:hypothetical protein